jgi:hypothetical protein
MEEPARAEEEEEEDEEEDVTLVSFGHPGLRAETPRTA